MEVMTVFLLLAGGFVDHGTHHVDIAEFLLCKGGGKGGGGGGGKSGGARSGGTKVKSGSAKKTSGRHVVYRYKRRVGYGHGASTHRGRPPSIFSIILDFILFIFVVLECLVSVGLGRALVEWTFESLFGCGSSNVSKILAVSLFFFLPILAVSGLISPFLVNEPVILCFVFVAFSLAFLPSFLASVSVMRKMMLFPKRETLAIREIARDAERSDRALKWKDDCEGLDRRLSRLLSGCEGVGVGLGPCFHVRGPVGVAGNKDTLCKVLSIVEELREVEFSEGGSGPDPIIPFDVEVETGLSTISNIVLTGVIIPVSSREYSNIAIVLGVCRVSWTNRVIAMFAGVLDADSLFSSICSTIMTLAGLKRSVPLPVVSVRVRARKKSGEEVVIWEDPNPFDGILGKLGSIVL